MSSRTRPTSLTVTAGARNTERSGNWLAAWYGPIRFVHGKAGRFIDNGWYVGHDEPSVKFISTLRGSGNTMTYFMTMSK